MSLSKIATELDETIAGYMDSHSLNAMSKNSRSWRVLTEFRLYKDITISSSNSFRAQWLLLVLYQRPHLAKHIKTLTLTDSETESQDISSDNVFGELGRTLWVDQFTDFQNMIDEILGPDAAQNTRELWTSSILTLSNPRADSCFALILYLAKNVESINSWNAYESILTNIAVEHILRKVSLNQYGSGSNGEASTQLPWNNIQHCYLNYGNLRTETKFPLVRSLETLKIRGGHTLKFIKPRQGFTTTNLRTLSLPDSYANSMLRASISRSSLRNLTHLTLRGTEADAFMIPLPPAATPKLWCKP